MSKEQNLQNARFGRWTVQGDFATTQKGERKWRCRCDCGTERYVLESSLKYGGSKGCGCRKKEHDQALGGTGRKGYGMG